LNRRETSLEESRAADKIDFARRQENAVQVIGALELIIEKLQTIDPNTNDASLALAELNKLGASNPIMALVQVASTFSQESLDNVVTKMEDLRSSIELSIEDDKRQE
jgi:chaperonin cofactor prefoldin